MIIYEGIFFEGDVADFIHSLEKKHLQIINNKLHCTFKYRPSEDEIFDEIVGKEIEVLIIGYGCDGKNSGFEVELPSDIIKYFINYDGNKLKKPHITTSLAKDAKAVNTKDLIFEKLPQPYVVKGKFGYWIKDNNFQYVSYKKYKENKTKIK